MPLFVVLYLMSMKLEAYQASKPSGLKDETFLPTYLEGERRFGHGLNVNLVAGYCVNGYPSVCSFGADDLQVCPWLAFRQWEWILGDTGGLFPFVLQWKERGLWQLHCFPHLGVVGASVSGLWMSDTHTQTQTLGGWVGALITTYVPPARVQGAAFAGQGQKGFGWFSAVYFLRFF